MAGAPPSGGMPGGYGGGMPPGTPGMQAPGAYGGAPGGGMRYPPGQGGELFKGRVGGAGVPCLLTARKRVVFCAMGVLFCALLFVW